MSKITNDCLTRSGTYRMLYSCTQMATLGVKHPTVILPDWPSHGTCDIKHIRGTTMTSYTECQILTQHADYSLAEVTKQTSRDNVRFVLQRTTQKISRLSRRQTMQWCTISNVSTISDWTHGQGISWNSLKFISTANGMYIVIIRFEWILWNRSSRLEAQEKFCWV